MANIAVPKITTFGNSGAREPFSNDLRDHEPRGVLDATELNKTTLHDGVEFNDFEETIRSFVMARLGHPVVRVELTPYQIKTCIDEALTKLDFYTPMWTNQYAVFDASAGASLYEIPQYILNNLSYVVYKKTLLAIQSQAGTLEFDFFLKYFQDNYLFSNFGISDYYLMQSTLEMTRKILGMDGSWTILNNKYLNLTPTPSVTPERVLLEYKAIDTDTIAPAYRNWSQKYSLACAKLLLGEIRSKFATVPGPGGGVQFKGELLMQEGAKEKEMLELELTDALQMPARFSTF
ncbi:MAG: hypothetical protein ACXABN_17585 [Candidatus Thorarchaeota archaeon]|jgi:hypothetical protein